MSSVVAVVSTRPETVVDDYRRLLDLSGLGFVAKGQKARLISVKGDKDPGHEVPPWQLDAVGKVLAGNSEVERIVASPGTGAKDGAIFLPKENGDHALVLTVPVLQNGWGVCNAVAALAHLQGRFLDSPRATAEAWARSLAQGATHYAGIVCDGVLWGAGGGTLRKGYLQRNVLLAGPDPVAIDSVCLQLAGLNPAGYPWLQYLEAQGLGVADPQGITVRGEAELLAEPFEGAPWSGRSRSGRGLLSLVNQGLWQVLRRRALHRRYRASAWGQLGTSLGDH